MSFSPISIWRNLRRPDRPAFSRRSSVRHTSALRGAGLALLSVFLLALAGCATGPESSLRPITENSHWKLIRKSDQEVLAERDVEEGVLLGFVQQKDRIYAKAGRWQIRLKPPLSNYYWQSADDSDERDMNNAQGQMGIDMLRAFIP
ncbi:hypothetical protein ACKC9G_13475 [Pokkaliibacter sp. CJK22405]|uniref:hypothetical protein n=1 Tax=Pokkaliibacter sp. CJK22405 TaxID=3384615 RepID=UPI003984B7B2